MIITEYIFKQGTEVIKKRFVSLFVFNEINYKKVEWKRLLVKRSEKGWAGVMQKKV